MRQVALVILYQNDRVLLQHRDDDPAIRWPGVWAIFGGGVEAGETPEAAARREMQEELGLVLTDPLEPIGQELSEDRHRWIYAAPLTVPVESLTLMEGQGMALLSAEEIADRQVVPLHREFLRAFREGRCR